MRQSHHGDESGWLSNADGSSESHDSVRYPDVVVKSREDGTERRRTRARVK